ncbi:ABC transporter ATP-binding protein [Roseitranquillus sediminis]|uniref:ABC transporter ATP-binding protein n=1 Tax=Roseitranquillus sediminis TaxID=2809051 RepID=UPI001D0C9C10|nr:ABC transporter ATP-binding protein [Roseitranquillus sediminis]
MRLENISKRFGAAKAVDDVSLDVRQGEALGIIGANGAGKTTLLDLVAGQLSADAGRIELMQRDFTRASAARRCRLGVGRTFQIPRPFEELTVFENLLVAAAHGTGRSERAVAEPCAQVLEQTGLMSRSDTPAASLSPFERRRLELARALATGPRLLLLDEITAGLTQSERDVILPIIRAQGAAIIWTEHVSRSMAALVDRLMVLDQGRVIAIGKPEQVLASREVRETYVALEL